MENAKKARAQAKRRFSRSGNQLEKALNNEKTLLTTMEKRYSEFKTAWEKVQNDHQEYVSHLTEGGDTEEEWNTEEEWITELSDRFCLLEESYDIYVHNKTRQGKEKEKEEQERKDARERAEREMKNAEEKAEREKKKRRGERRKGREIYVSGSCQQRTGTPQS